MNAQLAGNLDGVQAPRAQLQGTGYDSRRVQTLPESGAGEGIRTPTLFRAIAPEAILSANSSTPAGAFMYSTTETTPPSRLIQGHRV